MKNKKEKQSEDGKMQSRAKNSKVPDLYVVWNNPDNINEHLMRQMEDIKVLPFHTQKLKDKGDSRNITCLSYPLFNKEAKAQVRQNIPPEVADEIEDAVSNGDEALDFLADSPMVSFKEIPDIFFNEFGRVMSSGIDDEIEEEMNDDDDSDDRAGLGNTTLMDASGHLADGTTEGSKLVFNQHVKVSIAVAAIKEQWSFWSEAMNEVNDLLSGTPFQVLHESFSKWTPENWARARGNFLCGNMIDFLHCLPTRHTLRRKSLLEFISDWVESYIVGRHQGYMTSQLLRSCVEQSFDVLDRVSALAEAVKVPKVLETAFTETGETPGTLAGWLDEELSVFNPLWKTFCSDLSAEFGGFLSGSNTYRIEPTDDGSENESYGTETLLLRIKSDRNVFLVMRKFVSEPSRAFFDANIERLAPVAVSESLFGATMTPWAYLADSAMISIFTGHVMEALLRWLNKSAELGLLESCEWKTEEMTVGELSETIAKAFAKMDEMNDNDADALDGLKD